jgi:hypothetical protein
LACSVSRSVPRMLWYVPRKASDGAKIRNDHCRAGGSLPTSARHVAA